MRARSSFALTIALASVSMSCELVTHAHDYEVPAAYQGFCNACGATTLDLHRPPCPTYSDAPDDGKTYVYAARQLYFAVKPDDMYGPSFDLGFDVDCSDRPSGTPVNCKARALDGGTEIPWKGLPHGIDNSLVQRIFIPLIEEAAMFGKSFDINQQYSQEQEEGRLGTLLIIEGWNGTPDDPVVQASIFLSPGVSPDNGTPRWDGTDRWDLYSDVPGNESKYFKVEKTPAYVSNGVLVIDYQSRGDVSFRFGSPENSFRIIVNQVILAGGITQDKLTHFTMSAIADLASTFESIPETSKVLSGCDPLAESYLDNTLPQLLVGAADMRRDPNASPDIACDGVSFSWAFDGQRALLGGYRPQPADNPDGGCL